MLSKFLLTLLLSLPHFVSAQSNFPSGVNAGNIKISSNSIESKNTNGDINLNPNGTGKVIFTDEIASRVPYFDADKKLVSSDVSDTELDLLDGLTGTILTDNNSVSSITGKSFSGLALDIGTFDGQGSTPTNPAAGFYKFYFKDDGKAYKLDSSGTESEVGSGGGGGSSGINILATRNNNAETGVITPWSEVGGGTLAVIDVVTDNTKVGNGTYSFSFDASAATDYAKSDTVTIPAGLRGANCLLQFYALGFDANITFQVHDGTNVVESQALTQAIATYQPVSINFICPSSGTLEMRVLAGANAAIGYFDEVHLGSALNLTNVSQASFVGGMESAGSSGCSYSENTSSGLNNFVDLGTGSGCNAWTVTSNGPGTISAQGTNDHRLVYTNQPPNNYQFILSGFFFKGNVSGSCTFRLSDGTNNYQPQSIQVLSATEIATTTLTFHVPITSTANRTYKLQASDNHGNSCSWINDSVGYNASWKIYAFPTSSSIGLNVDQTDYGPTTQNTITIGATITGPTKPTTPLTDLIIHEKKGKYLYANYKWATGVATGSAAGSGDYLFSLPTGLSFDSSVRLTTSSSTANANTWEIITVEGMAGINSSTQATIYAIPYDSTRFRLWRDDHGGAAAGFVGGGVYPVSTANVYYSFTIKAQINGWKDGASSPVVLNQISTNNSSGERIERATIFNSGTPTVNRQSGSWISSLTDNGTGDVSINIAAGIFSAPPSCSVTGDSGGGAVRVCQKVGDETATLLRAACFRSDVVSLEDRNFSVICMGPR